jgi:hypothetical protein
MNPTQNSSLPDGLNCHCVGSFLRSLLPVFREKVRMRVISISKKRSPFQITLIPTLSRITARGGRRKMR